MSKMVMKMRQLSPEQTPAYIVPSESGIIALAGWLRLGRYNFFLQAFCASRGSGAVFRDFFWLIESLRILALNVWVRRSNLAINHINQMALS
jgi:hypothetical protein